MEQRKSTDNTLCEQGEQRSDEFETHPCVVPCHESQDCLKENFEQKQPLKISSPLGSREGGFIVKVTRKMSYLVAEKGLPLP